MRLIFALCVFAFHCVALSNLWPHSQVESLLGNLAEVSIQGFFIISGALVYGSLLRSSTAASYASKRVRRVYPAYAVIILIPALLSLINGGALSHIGRYVAANLSFLNFLEPTLPGFFEGNRFPVINGALWTLKIEVMFYIALPFLMWGLSKCGRGKWVAAIIIYAAAELWRQGLPHTNAAYAQVLARQLPGQMSFFISGITLWHFKGWIKQRLGLAAIVGSALLALSFLPSLEFLRALGLTALIAFAAYSSGPRLAAARWGDISYGVYIVHFPIVNTLAALGLFAGVAWHGFALAALLVLSLSFTLWWGVERHFIRRTRRS